MADGYGLRRDYPAGAMPKLERRASPASRARHASPDRHRGWEQPASHASPERRALPVLLDDYRGRRPHPAPVSRGGPEPLPSLWRYQTRGSSESTASAP